MSSWNLLNIGSVIGKLFDGTKPLPVLTSSVSFCGIHPAKVFSFHWKCSNEINHYNVFELTQLKISAAYLSGLKVYQNRRVFSDTDQSNSFTGLYVYEEYIYANIWTGLAHYLFSLVIVSM